MHRVHFNFFVRGGNGANLSGSSWVCNFLEPDLRTPVGRIRTFASAGKVLDIIERGKGFTDVASRHAVDYGIRQGRGAVDLLLTDEQYAKLKR